MGGAIDERISTSWRLLESEGFVERLPNGRWRIVYLLDHNLTRAERQKERKRYAAAVRKARQRDRALVNRFRVVPDEYEE